MVDITKAAQANSNQLNAVDIQGVEPVITVESVKMTTEAGKNVVWIYYQGCNNRPWRVSVGMVRILMAGWGKETDNWIRKSVKLFCNPTVKYAGKEVGGIQVKAMSDINTNGMVATIALNRQQRQPYPVEYLDMKRPLYPQDRFDKGLPTMIQWLKDGKSLEQIVAQCQQTGDLTPEQYKTLQDNAPLHVEDGED